VGGASGPPPAPGGRPLEITIPDANSPNKFLPSNPRQGKPNLSHHFLTEKSDFFLTTLMKIWRLSHFYRKLCKKREKECATF
jgi:hypothetical protein